MRAQFFVVATVLFAALRGVSAANPSIDFNRDIRPILSDNCFSCHGPDEKDRQAELRFDLRENVFANREGRAVIAAGAPSKSLLVARVTSNDPAEKMPPPDSGKELSADQIALLERWIAEGAPWQEHWAYRPVSRPAIPVVADVHWPRTAIDRFVLSQLDAKKISPSVDAGAETLFRRMSFDLTGLPPDPTDVDEFVSAFAGDPDRAIDQAAAAMLASPRFGERLAVYWLDLVRYADTVGYHGDQEHRISPYRDYVIKAFNDNLPFDQFTAEQLAGDLLPEPTMWQRIASGYNRLLQTTHEGGAQDKEYLAKYAADRVRNASQVWLGATMGCAECHDHKFDPYTQKDFYSFAAFFADLTEQGAYIGAGDTSPTLRPPEIPAWNLSQFSLAAALEARVAAANAAGEFDRAAELSNRRAELEKQYAPTMVSVAKAPRAMRVLPRGDWLNESGKEVLPAGPAFLLPVLSTAGVAEVKALHFAPSSESREAGGEQSLDPSHPADSSSRRLTRLDLAHWLTSPDHPLTARVFVNRVWKLLLGRGLASLDDFGAQGEPPTHPELLDWLASDFAADWDVKRLVRQIVVSRVYRQSSLETPAMRELDPNNKLLARQGRRRLEAEFVRDSALAVSGLLVPHLGGPSARPYQPAGYYRLLNFPKREYAADVGAGQYRRGLYSHWQRVYLHPMLKAFDAPSREECTAERSTSNTPLAALALMNDPSFVEAARVFAARMMNEGGATVGDRLTSAWRTALSRFPSENEVRLLSGLYEADLVEFQADPDEAKKLLATGQAPHDDAHAPELAAYTSVARAIFNLNEFITRN